MKPILVIYHANCPDGFGAAYAAHQHFSQQKQPCTFLPASHGDEPPDCTGQQVYIVDFSYKRLFLKQICKQAEQVTIIDHHISAEKDLKNLDQEHSNLHLVFDMTHSGAVLSWQFFHQTAAVPELLLHVEDLDLWRFQVSGSRDVNAALSSHPFDFALWHGLATEPQRLADMRGEGQAINRYLRQLIEAYKKRAKIGQILEYTVPMVNCPRVIASQLLHELAQGHSFAAGYQDNGLKRGWSLRSCEDGANVADIAERLGGGGHAHAAGFKTLLPADLLNIQAPVTPSA